MTLIQFINFFNLKKKCNDVDFVELKTPFATNTKNGEQKFEIFVEDFNKNVQEIVTDFNSIYDVSYFCSNLHDSIDWKIKHTDPKFFTNFCPY